MMTTSRLFWYVFILITVCQNVFTEDVEEHIKISTENKNHFRIEKAIKKIGLRSQKLPISPFISQLTHNGDNLFFHPQIVMGSAVAGPFAYEEPHQETEDFEYKLTSSKEITESDKSESLTSGKVEIIRETKPCKTEPAITTTTEKDVSLLVIPEPPAYIPLNPPKASSLLIESIKVSDHQVSTAENLSTSLEISKPDTEIHEHVIIPEPVFISEPVIIPEPVVISEPVIIPEPPAYIPLNPPTLPFKIIPAKPKCPPTIPEVFKIPKCPPSISEKYKIFVCPSFALPQYRETLEINEVKMQPHFPYFLPGAISTNGLVPSNTIVEF